MVTENVDTHSPQRGLEIPGGGRGLKGVKL